MNKKPPPKTSLRQQSLAGHSRFGWRLAGIALALATAGLLVGFRQPIGDWVRLYGYRPPVSISQLAAADTMTPMARHLFYINRPQIQSKNAFNSSCGQNKGEQTIVLGCYLSRERGIFILSVTDPRLQGVEEVTAAHEMLHAAYDRLSGDQKSYVDNLLEQYYQSGLRDQRILDTINAYKKSEPKDVVDEMHSVFGTEVAQLPPPLEAYYKRYFVDRGKVAAFAASYAAAFTSRQHQIAAYDYELANLKKQIDANQAFLQAESVRLSQESQRLSQLKASGDIAGYNQGVAAYNAAVDHYNGVIAATKQLVADYNRIVDERNAIVLEEQQLKQAINGAGPAPIAK